MTAKTTKDKFINLTLHEYVSGHHELRHIDGNRGIIFHPRAPTHVPEWNEEVRRRLPEEMEGHLLEAILRIAVALKPMGHRVTILGAFTTSKTTFVCWSWFNHDMLAFDLKKVDECIKMIEESVEIVMKAELHKQGKQAS